jgi:transporter family-2 protein
MSLLIDQFGLFGMNVHPLNGRRILGAALMVGGIGLIARY